MEQNIRQYEAENKTGNPVLDTLLTAKTMECQQENITITSVADGRMLGFHHPGAVHHWAWRWTTPLPLCAPSGPPEKRLIKVAVYSQGGFAMLRFEHYTEAAPRTGCGRSAEAGVGPEKASAPPSGSTAAA